MAATETKETAQNTEANQPKTSTRKEKSTFEEVMASPVVKQVGKELVRGVFGMLFGTSTRRSSRKSLF